MLGRSITSVLIDGNDGWDTVSDYGDESEWLPGVEDPLIRNPRVEFSRHLKQTKGFDIDMKIPYDLNSGLIRPVPLENPDLRDPADIRDQKRIKLDGGAHDVYDATYGACSLCEKELHQLLSEHARKYEAKFCGSVALDHPFHRCRIEQGARAAFAHYFGKETEDGARGHQNRKFSFQLRSP
ncbi:hypothetical protein Tsubulata_002327 [Turnera subulata]|uniref:Uncharacterized protein n=1 Tax=Turnera subulata TaxID=218843 RepID=A0A9Q0JJY1_9ROSI|nr:hypothetical protein Tsubulata_002327 [Turnera subulata]